MGLAIEPPNDILVHFKFFGISGTIFAFFVQKVEFLKICHSQIALISKLDMGIGQDSS